MTRDVTPFDLVLFDPLDPVGLLQQSGSVSGLLKRVVEAYGLKNAAYLAVNLPGSLRQKPYISATYPEDWISHYVERCYHHHDPVVRHGFDSLLPIDWCQFDRSSPRVRRLFGEATEFGIGRHGLSFPIRGRHGERAIFTVTADETDQVWIQTRRQIIRDFQIIAHHAHRLVLSSETISPHHVHLSQREIACLSWAAMGKTGMEMAKILGIGERTVLHYLKTARAKLGAMNTTHAVAKAISMNIIVGGM